MNPEEILQTSSQGSVCFGHPKNEEKEISVLQCLAPFCVARNGPPRGKTVSCSSSGTN